MSENQTVAVPAFLVIEDVARVFRVSVSTVRLWLRRGQFPRPVRHGKRLLWTPEQVREAVEAVRGEGAAHAS